MYEGGREKPVKALTIASCISVWLFSCINLLSSALLSFSSLFSLASSLSILLASASSLILLELDKTSDKPLLRVAISLEVKHSLYLTCQHWSLLSLKPHEKQKLASPPDFLEDQEY
jgi:hypothetical protein